MSSRHQIKNTSTFAYITRRRKRLNSQLSRRKRLNSQLSSLRREQGSLTLSSKSADFANILWELLLEIIYGSACWIFSTRTVDRRASFKANFWTEFLTWQSFARIARVRYRGNTCCHVVTHVLLWRHTCIGLYKPWLYPRHTTLRYIRSETRKIMLTKCLFAYSSPQTFDAPNLFISIELSRFIPGKHIILLHVCVTVVTRVVTW